MTEREEQAITVLNTLYNNPLLSDIHRQALEVGIMAIKAASSSPQPKMGHWEKDEYGNIHCTFCGCNALYEKIHYPDDYFGKVVRAKSGFCPTCGAKMQEVRYGE